MTRGVDTVRQLQAQRGARLVGNPTQARRIDVRHIGKSDAKSIVVRTRQRVGAEQVDVIVDHHQVAWVKPVFTPPAALVSIRTLTPSTPSTRVPKVTVRRSWPS